MLKFNLPRWPRPPDTLSYGVAVLSVIFALIILGWMQTTFQVAAHASLFLCAVMFSAWFGGIRPGLLATALSSLAFDYYFLSPINSLAVETTELPRLLIFGLAALFITWLSAAQRSATESLRQIRDNLERNNQLLQAEIIEHKHAEEALHVSESRLQAAIDAATIGLGDWDLASGKIISLGHFDRLFGFAPGEFDGDVPSLEKRIHHDDLQELNRVVQRAQEEGTECAHEYRVIWPDASIHWIAGRGRFAYSEAGRPARMYGAVRDITERKQAEEALRESETKLKEAEQLAKIGYWERDLIADRITWSEETCRIFGLQSYDNILNQAKLQEKIHPDDRQLQRQALSEALQGSRLYDVEYRIVRPDGDMRFVHVCDEIVYDESGKPIRMFGAVQDITERKQAEEQIRRDAARMQVLAEMSRTLEEVGLDYASVLDTVVRRTAELIGDACVMALFSDDGQRRYPVAFYHRDPKALAMMHDAFLHTWQGGTDNQRDQTLLAGHSIYMPMATPEVFQASLEPEFQELFDAVGISSFIFVPLQVPGRVIGALGLIRDRHGSSYTRDDQVLLQDLADRAALIIQNVQLFRQVQGAHQRLQTLANQLIVAQEAERRAIARELHDEIGQVLTAVSANLQAIQLSPDTSTLVARLEESIALVDDALSRIRDLSLDLRPSMLDDFGLVSTLEWYIERQAERSGFEAKFLAEPPEMRLPLSLETTVFRATQIALTNVARHAQAKHVWVELHQHQTELEWVIRDDGVGFDVASALERAAHGATLGLLSMQERARLVHGELEIKSTLGQGTEIRARFPVS